MNDSEERTVQPVTETDARPRSWRRLIPRLSVRGTMILVLIIGGSVGWFLRSVRIQRETVEAIQKVGGRVQYDWIWADHNPFVGEQRTQPTWWASVLEYLGPDYAKKVVAVYLWDMFSKADDAVMVHVGRLNHLKRLDLSGSHAVTDVGLANLAGLTSLRKLELDRMGPGVSDAGAVHLKGLVNLEVLSLGSPRITSAGLAALRGMSRLEQLSLAGSEIDDLATFPELPGLKRLSLNSTPLDDAGLSSIARISHIETLGLENTRITDAGLAHLAGLKNLIHLVLNGTRITDAGLDHLSGLAKLESLSLNRTAVGDDGLRRLAGFASLGTLRLLELEETRVTDAGFLGLEGLNVCGMDISKTAVTEAAIREFIMKRPGTSYNR